MLKPRELNFTDSLMRNSYDDISPANRNLVATFAIVLSGFLYGGLHLTAWGSTTFHTPLEQTLWIIACCTVALGGLAILAGIWLLEKIAKLHLRVRGYEVAAIATWVSAPLATITALLYLASRVYLLVEVFWNLAFMDPRVYQTPNVRNRLAESLRFSRVFAKCVSACLRTAADWRGCSGRRTSHMYLSGLLVRRWPLNCRRAECG